MSEKPTSPTPPTAIRFHGLDPGELLARALHTVKLSADDGPWQPPTPGELATLLPQYRVESLLGHGGMGAVYKGSQVALDRPVAIKLLPIELAADADFIARFQREARTLARLQHSSIVTVYDFGQTTAGHLYFVMEYVDGTDLQRILQGPGLTPGQVLELIAQVCEALHYAHRQGVIHRDIKPANILITKDGRAKVADFGLARPVHDDTSGLTRTNVVMGTPDYMAPESRARGAQVDHRADIFALGVMLYEMLTGQRPHGAYRPPSQRVQVDVRIDEVVLKALQQEPDRRYQQACEMKVDVDRIRTTPPEKAKPASQLPGKKWLIAGAVIVAILALAWAVHRSSVHSPSPLVASASPANAVSAVPTTQVSPPIAPPPQPDTSAGWISLLPHIDPAADAVQGAWRRVADGVQGDTFGKQGAPRGLLQLPYQPPAEYDFRIAFTTLVGNCQATQKLTAFGHRFLWTTASGQVDAAGARWAGFDRVNGNNMDHSPAAVLTPQPLRANQRHESLVEVRRDHVTGYIDGRKIVDWPTDYHEMTDEGPSILPDPQAIGIDIWWSKTTFHEISVREVTGKGKLLRGVQPE